MLNVEQTLISQYANSQTITQLVKNIDAYIDPRADIDAFYNYVFDINTAQGFGLDILGRIVDIGRELLVAPTVRYFGFSEAGMEPFGQYPFQPLVDPASEVFILADDAYRQLILVKALTNITATNSRALNQLLQNMFVNRGRCYVNDMGGMQMRYTFEFLLTPYEYAIVVNSKAFPRPAGVGSSVLNTSLPCFGFSEAGPSSSAPFGTYPFISESATHAIS